MQIPKTEFDKLSESQRKRIQAILSMIQHATEEPEKIMKYVTLDLLLKLMQTNERNEDIVYVLSEMQEHDAIWERAAQRIAEAAVKMID
jgi:hypothetical protein